MRKSRYIVQGYQVQEIEPLVIHAAELTEDELDDYDIEDYLTEQEQLEAGNLLPF